MTIATHHPPRPERNPAHQRAMSHLHNGEWAAAIRAFEELLKHDPDNLLLRQALDDARLKAAFDSETSVRVRRWILPHQVWIERGVVALGIFLVLWVGIGVVRWRASTQARAELRAQWQQEASAFLAVGDLNNAAERFNQILADLPEDTQAQAGIESIRGERLLLDRYEQAVAFQVNGDCLSAQKIFGDLMVQRPDYRDVTTRMIQCTDEQQISQLLQEASTFDKDGQYEQALRLYEAARARGAKAIADGTPLLQHLATLYLTAAREVLAQPALSDEQLSQATSFVENAAQLDPDDTNSQLQRELLKRYVVAHTAHEQQQWSVAVSTLRSILTDQPDFLNGNATALLYDTLIDYGDEFRSVGDCLQADEKYRAAAALPVGDTTRSRDRRDSVLPCAAPSTFVTPPEPTATVSEAPAEATPTATVPPALTPQPLVAVTTTLPAQPPAAQPIAAQPAAGNLATYRNQIIFKSSNPAQPGFWKMDVNGTNRQFLGSFDDPALQAQYSELLAAYRLSPDGEFSVYVADLETVPQVYITRLDGAWPPRPLTTLTGISYDPQWAPNRGAILFVTQENGSDDIWIIGADGETQQPLIRNTWEWDKGPSWSPDGARIAFWSNRTGLKQIYVMDANGNNVRHVSNVGWDEFDPLWVR